MNFYNEHDPYAADWIEGLIAAGLVPPGRVDRRSITELQGGDLEGATQVHLFAGIAGWSEALRLAGWPADRSIFTGSAPCQPFSSAGKRKGHADERHLWPEMFRLVRECRPEVVVGEQVASSGVVGRASGAVSSADAECWIDRVRSDLEEEGYTFGFVILGAHSVGAPHRRQRLYWVAHAERRSAERQRFDVDGATRGSEGEARERERLRVDAGAGGPNSSAADAERPEPGRLDSLAAGPLAAAGRIRAAGLRDTDGEREGPVDGLRTGEGAVGPGGVRGAWDDFRLVACREPDGTVKWRRTGAQPCDVPLVDGIPRSLGRGEPRLAGVVRSARANRVGRLRGYGNAILPPLAAVFLRAVMGFVRERGR